MRSMTGYGSGHSTLNGMKFSVELNAVNRKQSDVTVSLPREFGALEPRLRDLINSHVNRGRLNVVINWQNTASAPRFDLDLELARSFYRAMQELQTELKIPGTIGIETLLNTPGVLRIQEQQIEAEAVWPAIEEALLNALGALIHMREQEGKHLAKDLIRRLKIVRQALRQIKKLHPAVISKHRTALKERIQRAGVDLPDDDERLIKEIIFFADKSDISEELIRLESHLAQFAHHLRRNEPVGRTLDFITQEIGREFNTLGSKANDAEISQLVVTCKAEMEKIREQIQNIE